MLSLDVTFDSAILDCLLIKIKFKITCEDFSKYFFVALEFIKFLQVAMIICNKLIIVFHTSFHKTEISSKRKSPKSLFCIFEGNRHFQMLLISWKYWFWDFYVTKIQVFTPKYFVTKFHNHTSIRMSAGGV